MSQRLRFVSSEQIVEQDALASQCCLERYLASQADGLDCCGWSLTAERRSRDAVCCARNNIELTGVKTHANVTQPPKRRTTRLNMTGKHGGICEEIATRDR